MRVCVKGTWPWASMQYILVINKEPVKLRGGLNGSFGRKHSGTTGGSVALWQTGGFGEGG